MRQASSFSFGFVFFFVLKIYLLCGFYRSLEGIKTAKRRVTVSKLFLCAYVFYIIANYDSWLPSVADLFLKSAFRWGFSKKELIYSFSIFLKLRTFAHHGNSCVSRQQSISLLYLLGHWQSKDVPVMLMGSSASVLKMDSSSRRSLAAFLTWEYQTTSWMTLKLPDSKGISFLTTQWGLCSQSIQRRGGGNQALSISYSLPPTRLFLSSQLVSKIFLFATILLLHWKTGAKAKNSVNSLCCAPMGITITKLIMCSMAAVLPARGVYGRYLGPWRR